MWLRRLGGQDVFRAPGAERYRLVSGKKQFTLEMEGSVIVERASLYSDRIDRR